MRVLEFEVEKQRVRKKPECDFSNIVSDTDGYLKAKFFFTGVDWVGCRKAASFFIDGVDENGNSVSKEYPVLLDSDNTCVIPRDALTGDRFQVSVVGTRGTSYKVKTGKTKVKQEVG